MNELLSYKTDAFQKRPFCSIQSLFKDKQSPDFAEKAGVFYFI